MDDDASLGCVGARRGLDVAEVGTRLGRIAGHFILVHMPVSSQPLDGFI